MRHLAAGFFTAILLVVPAVQGLAVEADPISPGSWTMILLPDTQHYVDDAARAAIFDAQTQWIADHKTTHNVKMVLHQGDVSNNNVATQYAYAKHSMDILRAAGVPYSIAPGNHDYGPNGKTATRDTLFNSSSYFGAGSTYATQAHFAGASGGFFEAGKTDNSWCTFSAGGQDWLAFSVEFGPRNEVVAWMDGVAAAHPGYNFILNTHAYLYSDSSRYDWAAYGTSQKSNPHSYTDLANSGTTINDGQELWDKLVKKHPTWKFTINGHVLNDGTGWLSSYGDDGNVVHQMLANYQSRDAGGEGYLRIMEFVADGNTVNVSTYSPYRGKYLQLYDQHFTLKMDELSSLPAPVIRGCSAASLNVYDSSNLWIVAGNGPGTVVTTSAIDLADVSIAVDEVPISKNQGVLMATVRQNSRNGYYGAVEVLHANTMAMQDPATLQIATTRAYNGDEYNMNLAVGFFPFADGWIGSHVRENGALLDHYGISSANVVQTAAGRYRVALDNVDSLNSGMIFAVSAQDGASFISTAPLADGTGWDVAIRDTRSTTFNTMESAPWSFVYVDYDAPGLVGGRIAADGNILHEEGDFDVAHPSAGVYQISIAGRTPADGVLLLNIAEYETSGITAPDDNIISYETAGDLFVVNVRDRNGTSSPLENGAFVFAFLPYDQGLMPAMPGDANYDGRVDALDAAVLAEHWGDSNVTWAMGDFNLDGTVGPADASILAANWSRGVNESSSIPEPVGSALLMTAAVWLGTRSRRNQTR